MLEPASCTTHALHSRRQWQHDDYHSNKTLPSNFNKLAQVSLRTQLLGNAAKEGKGSAGRKRSCLLLRIQDTHLLNMLVSDGLAAHTFAQNYFCSCTPPRAAETLSGNNGLSGTVHSCRKVFPFACLGDSLYVMYLQAVVKLLSDG